MVDWFVLDPEVPGGLGERAELDHRPTGYPVVTRLHFEFVGWLGDDLMTSHPVYLVTAPLASALRDSSLSGFDITGDFDVSVDPQLAGMNPTWQPPSVEWLRITGVPRVDDFGLTEQADLVVSSAALAILRRHRMDHCEERMFG